MPYTDTTTHSSRFTGTANASTLSPLPAQHTRRWALGAVAGGTALLLTACSIPLPRRAPATSSPVVRRMAAEHIYARYPERIYRGVLPPMLYAVGVLDVTLTSSGQVQRLSWMRAPSHAPQVMREIERIVRSAAPYPLPRSGREALRFTEVWLWDKSGRFQLDTLTEGQRGE